MAQRVTELDVAVCAVVTVDIDLTLGHDLVDSACILHPREVEILPEGGSAHVQHAAPVFLDIVKCACKIACKCLCLEDIVTKEGRIAVSAAGSDHLFVGLLGICQACQYQQSRCLLGAAGIGHVLLHANSRNRALFCQRNVTQRVQQCRALVQRDLEQTLQTCVDSTGIIVVGPVHKSVFGHVLHAVLVNAIHQHVHQTANVISLLGQIYRVAHGSVPVVLNDQPPDRVRGNAVHPVADGRFVTHDVQGLGHDIGIAKGCKNGLDLGVHVTDPNKAVALDAVPQIFLNVEVCGICSGIPDLVESLVRALEAALVLQIHVVEYALYCLKGNERVLIEQLDVKEAVAGLVGLNARVHAKAIYVITDRVVVGGVLLAKRSQCLHDALTKTDCNLDSTVVSGAVGHPGVEACRACELNAEVEQNCSVRLAGLVAQRAVVLSYHQRDLVALFVKQMLSTRDVTLGQNDSLGNQVSSCTGIDVFSRKCGELINYLFCHVEYPFCMYKEFLRWY